MLFSVICFACIAFMLCLCECVFFAAAAVAFSVSCQCVRRIDVSFCVRVSVSFVD